MRFDFVSERIGWLPFAAPQLSPSFMNPLKKATQPTACFWSHPIRMVKPKHLVGDAQIPSAEPSHYLYWYPEPVKLAGDTVRMLGRVMEDNVHPRRVGCLECPQSLAKWLDGVSQCPKSLWHVSIDMTLG